MVEASSQLARSALNLPIGLCISVLDPMTPETVHQRLPATRPGGFNSNPFQGENASKVIYVDALVVSRRERMASSAV